MTKEEIIKSVKECMKLPDMDSFEIPLFNKDTEIAFTACGKSFCTFTGHNEGGFYGTLVISTEKSNDVLIHEDIYSYEAKDLHESFKEIYRMKYEKDRCMNEYKEFLKANNIKV